MTRRPDETRSSTYLRDGLHAELQKRAIRYFVEIQIHDADVATADHELFNSSVAWDTDKYPWQRLVEIAMTTPMSTPEMEKTGCNTVNRPDCLSIPPPKSKWDYNSIPYLRERTYAVTQWFRRARIGETGDVVYTVTVKTKMAGGTGSNLLISIIGKLFLYPKLISEARLSFVVKII